MCCSFVPSNMQFAPMNYLYEDGRNPWSVHHYSDKIVVRCGSYDAYKQVESTGMLPKELYDYLSIYSGSRILMNRYPGSLDTMLILKPQINSDENKCNVEYYID